jgi:2OG-Fe(II) oxygenase superfamily
MRVLRPQFPAPVLCIDEFLSDDSADRILQECLDLKRIYLPARVYDTTYTTKVDPTYRKNEVIYLDDVFRDCPERSDTLTIIKKRIWDDDCRNLWHDGYYIFDVINYSTWQEAVISRYGSNEYYHKHQDTRRDHITFRLVTLVYYVHRTSARFSGGSLRLWHGSESIEIEPKHNRAVVFPSFMFHEVEEVQMSDDTWENGRFSINYWIGFR